VNWAEFAADRHGYRVTVRTAKALNKEASRVDRSTEGGGEDSGVGRERKPSVLGKCRISIREGGLGIILTVKEECQGSAVEQ
jgi:hypothetical protein